MLVKDYCVVICEVIHKALRCLSLVSTDEEIQEIS